MINCKQFYDLLKGYGINFFTGVPDSLLKDFCAYIEDNLNENKNIIAANEGNAVAIAAGNYLATGDIGLVYMQNSGIGNALNPIVSLINKSVYKIPMLFLIGWRGEPDIKDEPQHVTQGKITLQLLETMGVRYSILPTDIKESKKIIDYAINYMKSYNEPYALVIKKNTFEPYRLQKVNNYNLELSREKAIKIIINNLKNEDIVIATTGKTSRELFEYREVLKDKHEKDFLTVGSMGHASQIAVGIALQKEDRKIYCFDGDGALIMHLGGLAVIGSLKLKNFKHVVFNNGAHDSVGGQPTVGFKIDICKIAKACGYKYAYTVESEEELCNRIKSIEKLDGPVLLEVKVLKGSRNNLGRPTKTPIENKEAFIRFIRNEVNKL